jgi:hypothetical protein
LKLEYRKAQTESLEKLMTIHKNNPVKMERYKALYTELLERALGISDNINEEVEEEEDESCEAEDNSSPANKRRCVVVPDTPPDLEVEVMSGEDDSVSDDVEEEEEECD